MKTVWKKWNLVGLITMTLSLSVFLLNAACVSEEKNNIVLELEKASLNLGSSITAEDRDTTPLSEQ